VCVCVLYSVYYSIYLVCLCLIQYILHLQEYEEYRRLHIIQKEEKERVEQKYNEAMAMNLPTKQAIDSLKRQQTDKLTEFREIVRLSVCLSETSSLLFYSFQVSI